jgi:HlyD family secretion protein
MGWHVAGALGLAIVAGAVAVYLHQANDHDGTVSYRTVPVERGTILTEVTASGTVNPVITTEVSSQLSGQVAELLVDFNAVVRYGQPLARLDPQSFAARVREAEAQLDMANAEVLTQQAAIERAAAELSNARALRTVAEAEAASERAKLTEAELELKRRRNLSSKSMISEADIHAAQSSYESAHALLHAAEAQLKVRDAAILAAEAGLRMAEADLEHARAVVKQRQAALDQAQVDLARTEIRAPIDGIVIRRDVAVGKTVAASLQAPTLFTLAQDLSEMKVEVKIDEADIGRIKLGQPVSFTVDAYPGRHFTGSVVQIRKAHEVFQNVVTYTAIVSAMNRDQALFPGMTAIVRIVVEEAPNVLKVPNAALRFVPSGREDSQARSPDSSPGQAGRPGTVWVLDEAGNAQPVAIRTGASDSRYTAVLSGPLQQGRAVIVGAAPSPGKPAWLGLR